MKNKTENIVVTVCFLVIIYGFFVFNLITPSQDLSFSERRRLTQFPELSIEKVLNASFMKGFNDYTADQFPLRDEWRGLKSFFDLYILGKYDVDGNFAIGDMLFKTEYPLSENNIRRLCSIINYCDAQFLDGLNVYYAIIPDKNYYLKDTRYLTLDYDALNGIVRENLNANIRYIDLYDTLTLDSYFLSDSHWKQEELGSVVAALSKGMGVDIPFDISQYTQQSYSPFYGVFHGQLALNTRPDDLIYLVNDTTQNAVVVSLEKPGQDFAVYDETALGGMDSYYLFVLGPAAVVTITNPSGTTGRELIIFRDSFASSLAPLMLEGYDSITLIDLRYIRPDLLGNPDLVGDYVDFTDKDVLFLFSSTIFNNSNSVKNAQDVEPFSAEPLLN